MKKIFSIFLCFVLIISLCSCSSSDHADIRSKGTLVVGVTEYVPMDYRDSDGNWIGFDAELAKLTADKLGVDVEYKIINWDEKVEYLNQLKIDCIWNGYTVNEQDSVDFSASYAKNSPVLVVRLDDADKISDVESLKNLSVAFEKGSSAERIIKDINASIKGISCDLQKEALEVVESGDADACVVDKTIFDSLVHSDLVAVHTFESDEFAVGFRKGSDLVEKINTILEDLKEDGTVEKLSKKYKVEIF